MRFLSGCFLALFFFILAVFIVVAIPSFFALLGLLFIIIGVRKILDI